MYSCGSDIHDIDVVDTVIEVNDEEVEARTVLDRVYVRLNLVCNTIIELPYYSAGYEDVCIHCGDTDSLEVQEGMYPICTECLQKKRKQKKTTGEIL